MSTVSPLSGSKKYAIDRTAFPCGKCLNCRINKAKAWTARILLESLSYEFNSFVTLTYSDDFLPCNKELLPRDVTLFIKKLRNKCKEGIRYYYSGEYGEEKGRPHYHIALFNFPDNAKDIIKECWTYQGVPMGNILVGDLNKDSARYIAGYVTKGANQSNDYTNERYLYGRRPEFHRMSRNPGLGYYTLLKMVEVAKEKSIKKLDFAFSGGKIWLDRYLRHKSDEMMMYDRTEDFYKYVLETYDKSKGLVSEKLTFEALYQIQNEGVIKRSENVHRFFSKRRRNSGE